MNPLDGEGHDQVSLRDLYELSRDIYAKMDALVATTNHRLDRFEEALSRKVNDVDLMGHVILKTMTSYRVWAAVLVVAAVAAPVLIDHWRLWLGI